MHELGGAINTEAIHLMVERHCLEDMNRTAKTFADHEFSTAFKHKPSLHTYYALMAPTSLEHKKVSINIAVTTH